jgi:hypothetical protein
MRWILLVAALAMSVGSVGCKKKPAAPAKAADDQAQAQPQPRRDISQHPPNIRPGPQPITVDEVKGSLPAFDDARITTELGKAPIGEAVQIAWCFDQGQIADIAEKVRVKLGEAGWQNTLVRAIPNTPPGGERFAINGFRKPYIVFGALQHDVRTDCTGKKGQSFLQLYVRKQDDHGRGGVVPLRPPPRP